MKEVLLINKQSGFTFAEVMVATGVVVLVMVSIASGVSFAVKNTRFSKEKTQSIRLAQESMEWIRSQRDLLGWRSFYEVLYQDGTQFSYCLTTIPETTNEFSRLRSLAMENCDPIADSDFTRKMHLNLISPDQVDITSEVTWDTASELETTTLTSTLREWR